MQQHFYAGYAVLTLLLWRLAWGLVGSKYSRFRSFFFPVHEIIRYAKSLLISDASSAKKSYLGHNPLGAMSALAIIGVLLLQAGLGLFSSDDYFFGPLAGLVDSECRAQLTQLHLDNTTIIYALLGLHVAAIVYYRLVKNEPLTKAMITGQKTPANGEVSKPAEASNLLALALLIACIGLVYWLVNAFTDLQPSTAFDYF